MLSKKLNKYSSLASGQPVSDYYKNTPQPDSDVIRQSSNFSETKKFASKLAEMKAGHISAQSQKISMMSDKKTRSVKSFESLSKDNSDLAEILQEEILQISEYPVTFIQLHALFSW